MTGQIWQDSEIIHWTQHLLESYEARLGQSLIGREASLAEQAETLFSVPFVVVSHGTQADPIFNYGNQTALDLWETTWGEFRQMPSRQSVRDAQEERAAMLLQAKEKGYIDRYQGIRVTRTGKLFKIENVIVWNITDLQGEYLGQAATFPRWEFLQ